jgi:predicted NAD/FAD-binding protein
MRIAIVGAGISGLVAAHRLHGEHEITVYEAGGRLGGHSNTVRVDLADETHWVDTGFIVYNDRNYPNFEPLLAELGVQTQASHMSFSVSDGENFEYAGTPRGLFAKPSHAADPRFLRMLGDLARFNREARTLLATTGDEGPSLREFLSAGGYGDWFVERLIVPQAAAVWSADPAQMWSFPAAFLARFFDKHGMLGLRGRPRWRTGWNYHLIERPSCPRLTYWMNNLQSLRSDTTICVTLNLADRIDPEKVVATIAYEHPVFSPEAIAAQGRRHEISGVDRTHYCGAYWGSGFHEDGVVSALQALERVGSSEPLRAAA